MNETTVKKFLLCKNITLELFRKISYVFTVVSAIGILPPGVDHAWPSHSVEVVVAHIPPAIFYVTVTYSAVAIECNGGY